MAQPTPQQVRALEDLRHNTHVTDFLQTCLDDTKTRLVSAADAEAMRVLQGKALAYQDLLNRIEGKPSSGKR